MKNDLRVRCVQSLFLLAATILFMIALSVCGKIFFFRCYCGCLAMVLIQLGKMFCTEQN